MKRMQFDGTSLVLGGCAGLGAGAALGYLLSRRLFGRRLDREVAAIKAHYLARSNEDAKQSAATVGVLAGLGAEPAGAADLGGASAVNGEPGAEDDPLGDHAGTGGADDAVQSADWPPVNRDISQPYVISQDEFAEAEIGWQQLTITYYSADNVLVDDKEQPIRDVRNTTGPIARQGFGGVSGDEHIRLVRNEKLELDFEICWDDRSYADVVLNYGNPDRKDR